MPAPIKVLVVDDESEIRRFVEAALKNNGYIPETAEDGKTAIKLVNAKPPELMILDLGLPDMDGKDVIVHLRTWTHIPIIVLSARDQETEKVAALEAGADDYLTKPFGTAELLARIRVALRHASRTEAGEDTIYAHDSLVVDLGNRRITLDGQEVRLTPTEYKLLAALALHPGKVMTQSQLINEVWGRNSQGNSQYLRIYVQHLREKLADDPLHPRFIITEPGIGYRLNSD